MTRRRSPMGRLIQELIADAILARNDLRRQGDELLPLGKRASRMFLNVPLVDDDAPRGALEGFVKNSARTADFQAVWEEATHFEARLADFRHRVAHVVEAGLAGQIIEGQQSGAVADTLDPRETALALAAMVDRYCYLTIVVDGVRDRDSVQRTTDLVATLRQNALQLRDRARTSMARSRLLRTGSRWSRPDPLLPA